MLNEYPPCVDTEFAHTHDYADYWGVFFYARSTDGDWIDRLDISAIYTDPIFDSIMHRFWRENDGVGEDAPQIVIDWLTGEGWQSITVPTIWVASNFTITASQIPLEDLKYFLNEMALTTDTDLFPHALGNNEVEKMAHVEEIISCIKLITWYISTRTDLGLEIWIEND
jgi:hypothetical protein